MKKIPDGQLVVVDSRVIPEIVIKVLKVKKILASREETSSSAACERVGISRSAYYKYKDLVFAYEDNFTQKIINLFAILKDEVGVLSRVLLTLQECGANIQTVNQNVPTDGAATIYITIKMRPGEDPLELTAAISKLDGVIQVKIISGE
jgi:chorismate mutase